jgi:hypothetical protein
MNGFHSRGRGISAHEIASTIGKKMANSKEGKTTEEPCRRRNVAQAIGRLTHFPAVLSPVHVLLAAALLLPAFAPSARADNCGGVKTAHPHKRAVPGRPPLVIGDSVLLGAVPEVAHAGYEVNTRGCRQMKEGLRVLASKRRTGRLPSFVVLMLGANWKIAPSEIRTALRIIGLGRLLGLVTPRKDAGDSRVIQAAGRRYPHRVVVLDWGAATARHPGWFAPDGNHLGPGGAHALARFLRRALRYAIPLEDRWNRLGGSPSGDSVTGAGASP